MRDSRAPRTEDEKDSGYDQDRAASEFVGERPGKKGPDRASQQNGRDVEPGPEIRGMKSPVKGVHSPIDDTTIETKEKATERRHHRYPENIKTITGRIVARRSWLGFIHGFDSLGYLIQKLTLIW